jgi:hypothetical protein
MPYAISARLDVTNTGSTNVDPLYYHVNYYELDSPIDTDFRFHAQWHRQNPTSPNEPFTILKTKGHGHYVGCHLFMQNRAWWLRPALQEMILPYGFGMGMLEGWEAIYVDDETTPSTIGTGTEDYFGGSFYYYQNGRFSAPFHGCTVRDYVRGQVAAYRFDIPAPVPFRKSLHITIDHGFENKLECDYRRVTFWYQSEPHPPFLPLPSVDARRATLPIANAVQMMLVVGTPLAAGLILAWRKIGNRSAKDSTEQS